MSEKYNFNRKLGTVKCDNCGKEFQKPQSEINRNAKLGRNNYCCRECSAGILYHPRRWKGDA